MLITVQGPVPEIKLLGPAPSLSFVPLYYIKRYRMCATCLYVTLSSVAPAALNHHVLVLLEDHIWLIQEIEHRYWWQLCWSTARLWHLWGIHQVHQRLNDCMICGIHVSIQWEVTFPTAVKGIISIWCNNPILKWTTIASDNQVQEDAYLLVENALLTCHSRSLKLT